MNCTLKIWTVAAIFLLFASRALAVSQPAIIPLPQSVERQAGVFRLEPDPGHADARAKIIADRGSKEAGLYLAAELQRRTGLEFQLGRATTAPASGGTIRLVVDKAIELGSEGYELTVAPDRVGIRARDHTGLFYGMQSFLQLLPPANQDSKTEARENWELPCVRIKDDPRFRWRGMMLDVSRHFFSKDEVKQLLDTMAAYKLNTFHWHLADDQGWRIEIKKYPRLTQIGGWRKDIGFGLDPKQGTAFGPDGRYGGYYTQADIREVVAYAQARHITIVPEIEMPGHSCAALMAYPQYSCTGGPFTTDLPGGIFNGVFCAGNDESFGFLQGVLSEVFELFPGKYVHIGGDEVLTNNWKACSRCQARMRTEGLKHEMELEGYFIRRMEKFINAHQRTLIGWSEIREGGLARNATVMDWSGGGTEAAGAGHDVVMSPLDDCYFDHYQSKDLAREPHAIGGYLPLEKVYAFEPLPAQLPPEQQFHILGAQANVWTEYMPSFHHVQYMVFPRLCALAEVVWSPKAARDFNDFSQRLETHYKLLEQFGINYRHPSAPAQQASSEK